MEKEYKDFVEQFRGMLLSALGLEEEDIFFAENGNGGDGKLPDDRLFVRYNKQEDACEVCGIHIREAYNAYSGGMPIESMVRNAILEMKRIEQAEYLNKILEAAEYDKVKEKLFIRLINAEKNSKELEHAVYKVVGDIALVLYMVVEEKNNRIASAKIRKEFINNWNLDKEQIFSEALLNTYYISPPRIYRWEELIYNPEYDGDNFMDLLGGFKLKRDAMGNCLSTTKRTNGAVAAFLPGVANRIGDLLEGSFYLVFTSIHEVMIHLDTKADPEDLKQILKRTIDEATPEEDILTYKIYHYDREAECFACVSQ